MNKKIVPDWAYEIDVHAPFEYFDDEESDMTGLPHFTLPSIAQQWKEDMKRRVANTRRTNPDAYPVLRAPQSFIDTGRWPADTPRPASN